jgi:hypothetical protein
MSARIRETKSASLPHERGPTVTRAVRVAEFCFLDECKTCISEIRACPCARKAIRAARIRHSKRLFGVCVLLHRRLKFAIDGVYPPPPRDLKEPERTAEATDNRPTGTARQHLSTSRSTAYSNQIHFIYSLRDIAPSDRDNQAIWICASRRAAGAGRRPARVPCCAAPARRDAAAYEPLVLSGSCRYTIRQNHSGRTSRALTDNAVQRVTLHVISRIFRSSSSLDHQHVPVLYMC